jgi:hypothetical protein
MISFSFCVALTTEEVFWLVSRLLNKDPPSAWPASVPALFYSENPPPLVRASIFIDLLSLRLPMIIFCLQKNPGDVPKNPHRCGGI